MAEHEPGFDRELYAKLSRGALSHAVEELLAMKAGDAKLWVKLSLEVRHQSIASSPKAVRDCRSALEEILALRR